MIIISLILMFILGYSTSNLIRLDKVNKCLKNLSVDDPHFSGKLEIIGKFNTLL